MPSSVEDGEPAGFDGDTSDWAIRLAENPLDNAMNIAVLKNLALNTEASPELGHPNIKERSPSHKPVEFY
ncbi:hypothetical protein CJO92_01380 [Ralstonia solanacearum]|uniref:Uncharacterized protein n=2 Tax=Ralstonia solanacearum species complex TaxID=3116862 RepID=A0AAD0SBJ5_RALSL|nr:hypothetical protein B0B51_06895 [blood disease bacterium A2-HR MARDI]AXV83050.1 hypothetical protein CJO77_01380 [Ralstonia solanacearum]AXW54162.1 hypothetical protein CJO92_01380 [Ralstonia solanacearum]